jgi:hypothetical protein
MTIASVPASRPAVEQEHAVEQELSRGDLRGHVDAGHAEQPAGCVVGCVAAMRIGASGIMKPANATASVVSPAPVV